MKEISLVYVYPGIFIWVAWYLGWIQDISSIIYQSLEFSVLIPNLSVESELFLEWTGYSTNPYLHVVLVILLASMASIHKVALQSSSTFRHEITLYEKASFFCHAFTSGHRLQRSRLPHVPRHGCTVGIIAEIWHLVYLLSSKSASGGTVQQDSMKQLFCHLVVGIGTIKSSAIPKYVYARDCGLGLNDSMGPECLHMELALYSI